MSAAPNPTFESDDPLDIAADQVIAACDGDVRAAVRALIVAKGLLEAELNDVLHRDVEGIRSWPYQEGRIALRGCGCRRDVLRPHFLLDKRRRSGVGS
jgi:hypothetical protein